MEDGNDKEGVATHNVLVQEIQLCVDLLEQRKRIQPKKKMAMLDFLEQQADSLDRSKILSDGFLHPVTALKGKISRLKREIPENEPKIGPSKDKSLPAKEFHTTQMFVNQEIPLKDKSKKLSPWQTFLSFIGLGTTAESKKLARMQSVLERHEKLDKAKKNGYEWCQKNLRLEFKPNETEALGEIDRCVTEMRSAPGDTHVKREALTYLRGELNSLDLGWWQGLLEALGLGKRAKLLDKIQKTWASL